MKTAVCLSGQPREVSECWRSWRDYVLLQFPEPPDVFIHTSEDYPADEEFVKTIQPKAYTVEGQPPHPQLREVLWDVNYFAEAHMNSFAQQLWGFKRVWRLKTDYEKQNNVVYDLTIRLRPDLIFLQPVPLAMLELDRLNNLHHESDPKMAIEFCVGPDKMMAEYFDLYDWLLEHGRRSLTKVNPRTTLWKGKYDCDTILATRLYDCGRAVRGRQKRESGDFGCYDPYTYYRIMRLHKSGAYDHW